MSALSIVGCLLDPTVLGRTDFAVVFVCLFCFVCFFFSEDEKAKHEVSSWTLEGDVNTNPWSGYRYTGKLRPHYPLVSVKWHSVLQHWRKRCRLHSVTTGGPEFLT